MRVFSEKLEEKYRGSPSGKISIMEYNNRVASF